MVIEFEQTKTKFEKEYDPLPCVLIFPPPWQYLVVGMISVRKGHICSAQSIPHHKTFQAMYTL